MWPGRLVDSAGSMNRTKASEKPGRYACTMVNDTPNVVVDRLSVSGSTHNEPTERMDPMRIIATFPTLAGLVVLLVVWSVVADLAGRFGGAL